MVILQLQKYKATDNELHTNVKLLFILIHVYPVDFSERKVNNFLFPVLNIFVLFIIIFCLYTSSYLLLV